LKRDMELAMLDVLVSEAQEAGIRTLLGQYLPTKKNGMVEDHYEKLGFDLVSLDRDSKASVWMLDVTAYTPRTQHIRILEPVHG